MVGWQDLSVPSRKWQQGMATNRRAVVCPWRGNPRQESGRRRRIRTSDISLVRAALCPLSYPPVAGTLVTRDPPCQPERASPPPYRPVLAGHPRSSRGPTIWLGRAAWRPTARPDRSDALRIGSRTGWAPSDTASGWPAARVAPRSCGLDHGFRGPAPPAATSAGAMRRARTAPAPSALRRGSR